MFARRRLPRLRSSRLAGLLIVAATLLAYGQVMGFDFVNFDDPLYVTENPRVLTGLNWRGIVWAFTEPHAFNWSPLTLLSHMLDVELFGMGPAGHHATSLLLHVCNALLLYELLLRMTGAVWRSAGVAGLFALHPLHVESVAWVAERKDVLSTLFWLLATRAYVSWVARPSAALYAISTACLALGLAAKPMLISLPFTLLLLDRWPLGRLRTLSEVWPRVIEKLPLIALAAGAGAITLLAQERAIVPASLPLELRVANALWSTVAYLGKTLWPAGLSPLHPHPYLPGMGGEPLGAARVAAAALVLSLTTAGLLASRRAYAVTGWLWYLVTLLPVIGIVQVGGQGMADRYTYVSLIGIFVILAWGIAEADERLRARRPAFAGVLRTASAVALVALGVTASFQARHWRDSEALWTRVLSLTPGALAHYNMGLTLREQGRLDEASVHLRRVLAIDPTSARALNELGITLERNGDLEAAARAFRDSIALGPKNARAHLLLGNLLEQQGALEDAIQNYRAALAVNPKLPGAREALDRAVARRMKAS